MNATEISQLQDQIPSLRRYARALARDPDNADDLVQECLVRAVSRFDQFQQGTNLRRWLFTILHNVHCDTLRHRRRRGTHVPIEEWERGASCGETQTTHLEMRDFGRAFAKLPKVDQELLLLVGLEGFSYEEAASILGIAVGTVKSRLFRARERLRSIQSEMNSKPAPRQQQPERLRVVA